MNEVVKVSEHVAKKTLDEFMDKDLRGRAGALLANTVMLSRLALLPPLITKPLNENWRWSDMTRASVLFATDCLDGMIARKLGGETTLGAYGDPLIDKFATNCLETILAARGELDPRHLPLRLARDISSTHARTQAMLEGKAPNATKAGKQSSMMRMAIDVLTVSPVARHTPRVIRKLHNIATAGLVASGVANHIHYTS